MAKRNRIVINFDQARPEQRGRVRAQRSGRVGRVLTFIVVVLVVVLLGAAAGGYFWWRHYQSQPAYAIALLVDAAQRNDSAEMDRLLDLDKITADFVAQVKARVPASQLSTQADSLIATATPKLKPMVRDELTKEVQRVSERANGRPFPLIALAVLYVVDIKREGKTATGEMKFIDEQIKLTMEPSGDSWRIIAVQDDKLAEMIAEKVRKSISKSSSEWKEALEKQLKGLSVPSISQ